MQFKFFAIRTEVCAFIIMATNALHIRISMYIAGTYSTAPLQNITMHMPFIRSETFPFVLLTYICTYWSKLPISESFFFFFLQEKKKRRRVAEKLTRFAEMRVL